MELRIGGWNWFLGCLDENKGGNTRYNKQKFTLYYTLLIYIISYYYILLLHYTITLFILYTITLFILCYTITLYTFFLLEKKSKNEARRSTIFFNF